MTDSGRQGRATLIGGLVLLLIGLAFLARNLGWIQLDPDVLWPLLLVVVGVVIVAGAIQGQGRRSRRWAGSSTGNPGATTWGAPGAAAGPGTWGPPGAAAGAGPGPSAGPTAGSWGDGVAQVSIPAEGATRLELSLRLGAGRYRLRGGASSLVEASASEPTIHHTAERSGDLARVRLSTSVNPLAWGWRGGMEWLIGVASGVPGVLDIQAGAGSFDLDLSDVAATSAQMAIGAAELRLVLPHPHGDVPVRIEGGAASFRIEIPAGVEARVTSTGLVSMRGPSETPGYATAADRVTVSVTGGAASVQVIGAG